MKTMRSTFLAVAVVGAVCGPLSANAQDLCGTPKPPVELGQRAATPADDEGEGSEVKMREGDFAFAKGVDAVAWLRDSVSDSIERSKALDDLRSIEFEFPHHNNTTVVKGALLRQQALLERERFEVARLKLQMGSGSKGNVDSARKRYLAAREDFCRFFAEAGWAD
jgi:hypothetical protein